MQQMAKQANSKVIFMPSPANNPAGSMQQQLDQVGEGPSQQDYGTSSPGPVLSSQYSGANTLGGREFQNVVQAGNVQNI